MSSYISFWIKNKDGTIIRLCDFCRSSKIYQMAKETGIDGIYDKKENQDIWNVDKWAEPYTREKSSRIISVTNRWITETKERIIELNEKINLIKDMANSTIDEKLEKINDYENYIAEYKEDLESLTAAATQVYFLEEIRDTICSYRSSNEEKDNCLWAGIDCNMKGDPNEEE